MVWGVILVLVSSWSGWRPLKQGVPSSELLDPRRRHPAAPAGAFADPAAPSTERQEFSQGLSNKDFGNSAILVFVCGLNDAWGRDCAQNRGTGAGCFRQLSEQEIQDTADHYANMPQDVVDAYKRRNLVLGSIDVRILWVDDDLPGIVWQTSWGRDATS